MRLFKDRKKTIFVALLSLCMAVSFVVGLSPAARVDAVDATATVLSKDMIKSSSQKIQGTDAKSIAIAHSSGIFTYQLMHGTVDTGLNAFTYSSDTSYNNDVRVGSGANDTLIIYGLAAAATIRVSTGSSVVYRIFAHVDTSITITHPEVPGLTSSLELVYAAIHRKSGDTLSLLQKKALYSAETGSTIAANALGGEFILRANETLYFEIGTTSPWVRNIAKSSGTCTDPSALMPTFAFDTDVTEEPTVETQNLLSMLAESYAVSGGEVTKTQYKFTPMYTQGDTYHSFENAASNALSSTPKNANTYASVYAGTLNAPAANQLIRTDPANERLFALKIVTTKNVKLNISHAAGTGTAAGSAELSLLSRGVEEGCPILPIAESKSFSTTVTKNQIGGSYHVKAGDEFYFIYKGGTSGVNIKLMPDFSFDEDNYDETERYDFAAYILLVSQLQEIKEGMVAKFESLTETDYYETDWTYIEETYAEAIEALEGASTVVAAQQIADEFSNFVDSILDKTQIDAKRTEYKGLITAHIATLTETEYTLEYWQKIQTLAANAKAEIDTKMTETDMAVVKNAAVEAVNAVEKGTLALSTRDMVLGVREKITAEAETNETEQSLFDYNLVYGGMGDAEKEFKVTADLNGLASTEKHDISGYTLTHIHDTLLRVGTGYSFIYRFTLKQDSAIYITNEAFTMASNSLAVTVIQKTGTRTVTLKEKTYLNNSGSSGTVTQDLMGGEFHLKAGETLYFIFSADIAAASATPFKFPSFKYVPGDYDEAKHLLPPTYTTLSLGSVISDVYSASGNALNAYGFSYAALWGSADQPKKFDLLANGALQTVVRNPGGEYAAVYANGATKLIRVDAQNDNYFILKFSFDTDVVLKIENAASSAATNGTAAAKVVQLSEVEGLMYTAQLFEKQFTKDVEKDALGGTYHVPAGDTVCFVYATTNYPTNINLMPDFTVDTVGYDETKAFDFDSVIAAQKLVLKKQAELAAVLGALSEDDYAEADWATINRCYNTAESAIKIAANETAMDAIIAEFDEIVESIESLPQLAALRQSHSGLMDADVAALNKKKYSTENWTKIEGLLTTYKAKLDDALSRTAIERVYSDFKAEIALVEEAKKASGCGKAVAAPSVLIALSTLLVAFILLKKKERHNER